MDQKCEIMCMERNERTGFRLASTMEGPPLNRTERHMNIGPAIDEFTSRASEEVLSPLPNDLTRLIYLASIRDYNSGTYRHPQLSRELNATTAHRAFEFWHEEIFARLLTNSVSNY